MGKYDNLKGILDLNEKDYYTLNETKRFNVVDVTLHAGRGLLAMDSNVFSKASSDPQVKLSCGGAKKQRAAARDR